MNTGQFKICKTNVNDSDNLLGTDSFTFDYSYTVNGATTTGSVALSPGECSGYIPEFEGLPVLNNDGSAVTVTVSETPPYGVDSDGISWHLDDISYSGNGALYYASTGSGEAEFDLGAGLQSISFDNVPGIAPG